MRRFHYILFLLSGLLFFSCTEENIDLAIEILKRDKTDLGQSYYAQSLITHATLFAIKGDFPQPVMKSFGLCFILLNNFKDGYKFGIIYVCLTVEAICWCIH